MVKCFKIYQKKNEVFDFFNLQFFWAVMTYFLLFCFLSVVNFVIQFKSLWNNRARYTKQNDHLGFSNYDRVSWHSKVFINRVCFICLRQPLLCIYLPVWRLMALTRTIEESTSASTSVSSDFWLDITGLKMGCSRTF